MKIAKAETLIIVKEIAINTYQNKYKIHSNYIALDKNTSQPLFVQ